ncbi:hypothetical protein [Parasitella parasitica]|uniref:RRM domain-containing protein n=1 Tax=Parasitella parasitica TaxID=35722 RepID=A0A0B7NP71_9FUNG|nr:hypothetical protein [Parasitella parasitica]
MASTARQVVAHVTRQRAMPTLAIKACQRSIHSTYKTLGDVPSPQQQKGEKKSFAENFSNQFIDLVKKQRTLTKAFAEPSRFVMIDGLPLTATVEDIHKLAREAFTNGDKHIVETVFCRSPEFNFTGRCIVNLNSAEDARRLIEYGHRRVLGGHTIKIDFTGNDKSDSNSVMNHHRPSELSSITDSANASGRSVIITGLPPKTTADHLLGYLRSRNFFPVEGSSDNVLCLKTKENSTVSKYLVKFDSESEAWRCVRAFHNANFLLKTRQTKYRLQLSVAY